MRAPIAFTARPAGRIFVTILALWVVIALARPPGDAQDAVPLVVAGGLVLEQPDQVYVDGDGSLFDIPPVFEERSCPLLEGGLECDRFAVAFVSPPPALPLVLPLSVLPGDLALRLIRMMGALCLGAGMVLLWRRLSRASPRAPEMLAATAVLLTPLAMVPIGLGQTSPLMFLSACLGLEVAARSRRWAVAVAAVWSLTIAFKAVPAVLGLAVLFQRRWRVLGWSLGIVTVLSLGALVMAGPGIVGEFLEGVGGVADQASYNPYNGAADSFVFHLGAGAFSAEQSALAGWVLRAMLAVPILWWAGRLRGDVQWAFGWAALVVLSPLVWWHYAWLSFAGIGVAIAARSRSDRVVALLPVAAALALPLSIANARGWSVPVAQFLAALAALAVVGWLGRSVPEAVGEPSVGSTGG